ncbi:hypothetical protein DLJ53_30985 [Acuticoccus sediminis]|uniref:FecR family protein n=1 Tax=Acuticoccus sediminis TaxID=2184697 RepID=A0A8B2NFY4_9HYPH|nr:hypothetical protein [Acuticoccus sediminis]RAH96694.1 hypothetical protein DLJ53_30985 [Acuticoccus sediminis]
MRPIALAALLVCALGAAPPDAGATQQGFTVRQLNYADGTRRTFRAAPRETVEILFRDGASVVLGPGAAATVRSGASGSVAVAVDAGIVRIAGGATNRTVPVAIQTRDAAFALTDGTAIVDVSSAGTRAHLFNGAALVVSKNGVTKTLYRPGFQIVADADRLMGPRRMARSLLLDDLFRLSPGLRDEAGRHHATTLVGQMRLVPAMGAGGGGHSALVVCAGSEDGGDASVSCVDAQRDEAEDDAELQVALAAPAAALTDLGGASVSTVGLPLTIQANSYFASILNQLSRQVVETPDGGSPPPTDTIAGALDVVAPYPGTELTRNTVDDLLARTRPDLQAPYTGPPIPDIVGFASGLSATISGGEAATYALLSTADATRSNFAFFNANPLTRGFEASIEFEEFSQSITQQDDSVFESAAVFAGSSEGRPSLEVTSGPALAAEAQRTGGSTPNPAPREYEHLRWGTFIGLERSEENGTTVERGYSGSFAAGQPLSDEEVAVVNQARRNTTATVTYDGHVIGDVLDGDVVRGNVVGTYSDNFDFAAREGRVTVDFDRRTYTGRSRGFPNYDATLRGTGSEGITGRAQGHFVGPLVSATSARLDTPAGIVGGFSLSSPDTAARRYRARGTFAAEVQRR